jgi:hypothetical protein
MVNPLALSVLGLVLALSACARSRCCPPIEIERSCEARLAETERRLAEVSAALVRATAALELAHASLEAKSGAQLLISDEPPLDLGNLGQRARYEAGLRQIEEERRAAPQETPPR